MRKIVLMCILTAILSACSTIKETVVQNEILVPPSLAMQKAKPLPVFTDEKAVNFQAMVDMDIGTVRMYQELANQHNELVDWVNAEIVNKQKILNK